MKCQKCGTETGAEWKTLCYSCYKSRPVEEVRAGRQQKLDRKIARYLAKAQKLEKQAEEKQGEFKECAKDWAWVTQPNIATSRGRAFSRQRERVIAGYENGMRLSVKAQELREHAEGLKTAGVSVKGDAERSRQEKRERADSMYTVGSKVRDWCFGIGEVVKVNKKTYTVRFEKGSQFARDKSFFV